MPYSPNGKPSVQPPAKRIAGGPIGQGRRKYKALASRALLCGHIFAGFDLLGGGLIQPRLLI